MVNTWRIVVAALVIFAAGVMTGGLVAGLAGRIARSSPGYARVATAAGERRAAAAVRAPGAARIQAIGKALRECDLTPDERAKADQLLAECESRLKEIWRPAMPKAKAEVEALRKALDTILTPAELARFDQALRQPPSSSVVTSKPPTVTLPASP